YGGPYLGFFTTKKSYVHKMAGRLVGQTIDVRGQRSYVLTLTAREQHIKRERATSNICTNQGLAVTAATIFMSLLGETGLQQMALASYKNTQTLIKMVTAIAEVKTLFQGNHFHEFALQLPVKAAAVIEEMAKHGIQAGYDLGQTFPELSHVLLVCVTETKIETDLEQYTKTLQTALQTISKRNGEKNHAAVTA
ncbi:MAG: glycine dehydrogenase, partial [Gammaproteobacteria bacterium]